jgi:hypothetical protein
MIFQGKGGVGKSFVASLLAQYGKDKGYTVSCIDTDPVNATFAGYAALKAKIINILDGDDINPRNFDQIIEEIFTLPEEQTQMVIDNGSATFLPLGSYMGKNSIPAFLDENTSHKLRLHSVITGGQAMDDTLIGLKTLLQTFPNLPIVVWINPFFGDLIKDGKPFSEFKIYQENKDGFEAIITIPPILDERTFGEDLNDLLNNKLTFTEFTNSERPLMQRHRMKRYWEETTAAIDKAELLEGLFDEQPESDD